MTSTAVRLADTDALGWFEAPNGIIYNVRRGGLRYTKARRFAWSLNVDAARWDFIGTGPLAKLTTSMAISSERASQLGRELGICVVCGQRLTAEASIERAMGPVCFGRLG